MLNVIRSDSRGAADHGWLKSKHTFSFAEYHNPAMMGFGNLRVINEDWIEPGKGFGEHPHQDMEIVTYLIEGALQHKDSMGNGSVIRPGELQRMSAGTGVRHSEFNPSQSETAHLLQIWILPQEKGIEPGYEQKLFPAEKKNNQWQLVVSPDGRDGSLTIHQDITLNSTVLSKDVEINYAFDEGRRGFLQVVYGDIEVEGEQLSAGDAIAMTDYVALSIRATSDAELILFDMEL